MFHGAAITGDWSRPVPLRSLDEFRKQFGTYSPDNSMTYEYVSGLLSAGLPVLFQRIACKDQATVQWVNGIAIIPDSTPATKASYTYSHQITGETGLQPDIKVSDKKGGTYGNSMTVCIRNSNNEYWMDIKYDGTMRETVKIIEFSGSESDNEKKLQFITALNNLNLNSVSIEVLCPINSSTGEYELDKFEIPSDGTDRHLAGGTDVETPKAEKANYTYSHQTLGGTTQPDIKISERWGGSYGNKMTVCIRNSNNVYWMDIKYNSVMIEKVKIIAFKGNESATEKKLQFIDAVNNLELSKVIVEILCPINEVTGEYELDKFEIPSDTMDRQLANGVDFDDDLVKAEIPSMYSLIEDKILYLPKFITSGGYTDNSSSSEIGDAMEALTLKRQDCRALIDLPLGTLREDYQSEANKYGYSQLASNTAIPSASMAGPWLYMQLGNNQIWMPPSFVYLTVVGNAVSKGDKAYTPKAGLINGRVLNVIKPEFEIGSDICALWQQDGKLQINPIMRLQSNDFVIAGNSTLLRIDEDETNAFNESSADLAVIEIRRFIYNLATELQYQYNNASAFEKFSIRTSTYFNGMEKQGTISDYAIVNVSTDDDPRTLKIKINVLVTPTIKAIEIYLNVAYGSVTLNAGGEV